MRYPVASRARDSSVGFSAKDEEGQAGFARANAESVKKHQSASAHWQLTGSIGHNSPQFGRIVLPFPGFHRQSEWWAAQRAGFGAHLVDPPFSGML